MNIYSLVQKMTKREEVESFRQWRKRSHEGEVEEMLQIKYGGKYSEANHLGFLARLPWLICGYKLKPKY